PCAMNYHCSLHDALPICEVLAWGDLAADERATIELFDARKDSVVYISTSERVIDPWTRSIHDMPRGTGSGFLWDQLGHVITNRQDRKSTRLNSITWPTRI